LVNIISLATRRPVAVTCCVAAVLLFGFMSLSRLAVDWMPGLTLPVVAVVTVYPGADPETIELQVTNQVESALSTLSGLKSLESYSMENLSVVIATFTADVKEYEIMHDVNTNLAALALTLPSDAMTPAVANVDPRMFPIMTIGVTGKGELSQVELTRLVETKLKPELERVDGVGKVSVIGGAHPEISVFLDMEALKANNLTALTLSELIATQNAMVPAGNIEDNGTRYHIRIGNALTGAEDLKNLVIGQKLLEPPLPPLPQPVYLRNVADVVEGTSPMEGFARTDGKPAVGLYIFKDSGANTVRVSSQVRKAVERLNAGAELPLEIKLLTDQSQYVTSSIDNLSGTIAISSILVIAVLFFFLRSWRSILVIAFAIPLSLIIALILMYAAGLSLNVMSLGGLALGVGMLVDNAIVVLENIIRHRRTYGKGLIAAAVDGTSEVGLAISASTLTTIAVFLPLAFLESTAGQWFREMALTVTFALCASLLVAVLVIPTMAARLLVRRSAAADAGETEIGWILRLQTFYLRTLRGVTARPWLPYLLLAVVVGGGAASLGILPIELLPAADGGRINVTLTMPPGTPLTVTDRISRQLEEIMMQTEEVHTVWAQCGLQGDDIINILYSEGTNVANLQAELVPLAERTRRSETIAAEFRNKFAALDLEGGQVRVSADLIADAMGEAFQSGVQIHLQGEEYATLEELAVAVADGLRRTSGFINVVNAAEERQPELVITIDRTRALMGQITAGIAALTVRYGLTGLETTRISREGEEIPVIMRPRPEDIAGIEPLMNFPVQGMATAGQSTPPPVKLNRIAGWETSEVPLTIRHFDRQRTLVVKAGLDGIDLKEAERRVRAVLSGITIPPGYKAELAGVYDTIDEAKSELFMVLLLALALVFMVMAAQFESWRYPFIVMITVPSALAGGVLLLWLCRQNLSVSAIMGLVILIGVSVNNGIVMIDMINRLRSSGLSLDEAINSGSSYRLRPVLMTSATTIIGLLPLALSSGEGSELQAPLAIGFMGGMITSALLTLYIIPVTYRYLSLIGWRNAAPDSGRPVPPQQIQSNLP